MKIIYLSLFFISLVYQGQAQKKPADYVNPFIGASTSSKKAGASHGLGKTFPGATTPFGLVQISPNTITGGDNGPGYSYEHPTLEGFAFTQMSGTGWYGDLGNFLVMPTVGVLKTSSGRASHPEEGYRSRYAKEDEVAKAGYYAATLTDYHIRAEATAAAHSGILKFTFPKHKQSRIQIDLARRVGGTSTEQYVKVLDDHSIQGWMKCTPDGGGWGNGDGKADYTVYFFAEFSKPLLNYGVWSAHIPDDWKRKRENIESDLFRDQVAKAEILKGCKEKRGKHLGFYSEFATQEQEEVLLKVGISFVSMEGARKNLSSEIKDFNFKKVQQNATDLWNKTLGKMTVEGGDVTDKTIFYTALYHTMIDPRCFTDVDGKYTGGDGQIHQTNKFVKRTVFSGWDVFRSQFPLLTIIRPDVVSDMVNSLVTLADESGHDYLERWEFLNAYSGCMVGNPAVSVITDAYAKGIRNYDVDRAYQLSKQTVDKLGNGEKGYVNGSISETLEYAYSDWCMSRFAKSLNKLEDEKVYAQKGQNYRNIFDPSVNWFKAKNNDGSWGQWPKEGRTAQGYGCVESNPYQQGWFVPHDVKGMTELMGGTAKVIEDLSYFFEQTPENMMWNDYYNHANEPVHHVPFLFNRLGAPWLTQKWTREICDRAYHNSVEGLVGNEDVGQMSAWYVLAASGIHPVCPGDPRFEITSPVFDKISMGVDDNHAAEKKFVIEAKNNSLVNRYIQRAELNGKGYNKCYLDYKDIQSGGKLLLFMGPTPNKNFGVE